MMNNRLKEFISYKTGGNQKKFADLIGWTPQYLHKLLVGLQFGLQPVLTLANAMPELNVRWLLTGEGDMLDGGRLSAVRRQAQDTASRLLDLERLMPVMTPDELRVFEDAVLAHDVPRFAPSVIEDLRRRADEREKFQSEKFKALCKPQTPKP